MYGTDVIAYVIIIGAVAGFIHQLIDRAKANDWKAILRGIILGAVAGWLVTLVYPSVLDITYLYYLAFMFGYFGDSVILNIVERFNKDEEKEQEPDEPVEEELPSVMPVEEPTMEDNGDEIL